MNPRRFPAPARPVSVPRYISVTPNRPLTPFSRPQVVNGRNMISVPIPRYVSSPRVTPRPIMAPVVSPAFQKPSMVKIENTQDGRRIVHCAVAPKSSVFVHPQDGITKIPISNSMNPNYGKKPEAKIHHSRDMMNKTVSGPRFPRPLTPISSRPTINYPIVPRRTGIPLKDYDGMHNPFGTDINAEKTSSDFKRSESGVDPQRLTEGSFLNMQALKGRLRRSASENGMLEPSMDVAKLISVACEQHLTNMIEKLCVISEHRQDNLRMDPRYIQTNNPRAQLEFFKEIEETRERNIMDFEDLNEVRDRLERAHKSKMEKQYRHDTEITAMQAILGRKRPKLDGTSLNQEGLMRPPAPTLLPLALKRRKFISKMDIMFALSEDKHYRNFVHEKYMS